MPDWIILLLLIICLFNNDSYRIQNTLSQLPFVGGLLIRYHSTRLPINNTIVPNPELEQKIRSHVIGRLMGVRVFPAEVQDSLQRVLGELQASSTVSALLQVPIDSGHKGLIEACFPYLHFGGEAHFSHYLSETAAPVIIYFPNLDQLQVHDELSDFIVSLAEDSLRTKRYVVVVSVTDPEFLDEVLRWNGREKIYGFRL